MAESNDEENQTDSLNLGEVISQLNSSNETLKAISTNTEIGAEASIDSSGGINGDVLKNISESLTNIHAAICTELVGVIEQSNDILNGSRDILETISDRIKFVMEDIASITRVVETSADLDKQYSKSESNTWSKIERNTKSISDVDTEEKDVTEKVSSDAADQLEQLIAVLKAAGEGNKKFGEKSFDQFSNMIELLRKGEKKDTIKSLLWTKGSQESAKNIGKRFSELFKKNDDIRAEEKDETSKELQLELDLGSEFKASQKAQEEQLKIAKDQLKETINADKKSEIAAENKSQAGEQMQLQGLEDAAEAKTPGKQPGKLQAALGKVGKIEPGEVLGGMLGKVGGFVETVTGVVEGISAMTGLIGPLVTIVGELFLPVTAAIAIIVGLVDFVMGFIDGFKSTEGTLSDKIIGGIKQGLLTVLDDLLYLIVDLPKNLLSGLVSMLGFEDAAKWIDDLDITGFIKDIFGKAFDFYIDWFKELVAAPIEIFYGLYEQLTNMFEGSGEDIAKKIGAFVLDIMYLPFTLLKHIAAWVVDKFGFKDLAAKLKDFDIGKSIMDGVASAVHMITDFFYNAFEGVKGLWDKVKNLDFMAMLKEGLGGIIKTLLGALPFGDRLVKKALSVLGISDSGGDKAAASSDTAAPAAVAPATGSAITPSEANNAGANMNALQADTEQANAAAADAPVMVPSDSGSSGGGSSSTSVSSVTYNSNNVPDRTAWQMTPAFGY